MDTHAYTFAHMPRHCSPPTPVFQAMNCARVMPLALAMEAQVSPRTTRTKASQLGEMPGWVGVGVGMPFPAEVVVVLDVDVVLMLVVAGLGEVMGVDLVADEVVLAVVGFAVEVVGVEGVDDGAFPSGSPRTQ